MPHQSDERLDLWVETRLLRRTRSKRFGVPGYSRYPNLALLLLNDMEVPYTLIYEPGMHYIVEAYGHREKARAWGDLALAACRLLFRVFEGTTWKPGEPADAKENP